MTQTPEGASRVEAAEAGVHHEYAEVEAGVPAREHATAAPAVRRGAVHHHPEDPNSNVVRGRLEGRAIVAGALAATVMVVALVLFGLAIGGSR